MPKRAAESIIEGILSGHYDADVDDIRHALNHRLSLMREEKIKENKRKIKPGMRVVIVPPIRPKYFVGMTGVVRDPLEVGFEFRKGDPNESLVITLDRQPARRSRSKNWSKNISVPAHCVKRIPKR